MPLGAPEFARERRRVVVGRATSHNECQAVPGRISARRAAADVIEWVNRTGGQITISLPAGISGAAAEIHIEEGEAGEVAVDKATTGSHEYQIFCRSTNNFARGNSSPMIIIE